MKVILAAVSALVIMVAMTESHQLSVSHFLEEGSEKQGLRASLGISEKEDAYCPICQKIAGDLVDTILNQTDDKEIVEYLDGRCDAWFPKNNTEDFILRELCDAAVKFLTGKIFGAVRDAKHQEWQNIPQIFCSFVHICRVDCCLTSTQPEQVHLSFANNTAGFKSLRTTWTTLNPVPGSIVQWWVVNNNTSSNDYHLSGSFIHTTLAENRTYNAGGWSGMIYSGVMDNLPPNSSITYRVGSYAALGGWSNNFTIRTAPENAGQAGGRPLRIAQVADMGRNVPGLGSPSNGTIDHLASLAQSGQIDFVLHIGDISYANGDQHQWDQFMRDVEKFAAYVPYMTAPGNHECAFNFASYRHRFWLPEIVEYVPTKPDFLYWNLGYYDFRVGGVSITMLDLEAPFGGMDMTENALKWANASMANSAVQRAAKVTPWVLTAQHRPPYCTNLARDCGPNFAGKVQNWFEDMFYNHRVDVDISGHMHNYERTYPVYKGEVVGNGSFVNPKAPVYVLNGAGGNEEGNSNASGDKPWSAFHSAQVGYGLVTLGVDQSSRSASFHYQFILSSSGETLDQFTITKDWHQ